MNIRTKLIAGFLASAAITLVAGAVSYGAFQRLSAKAAVVDDVYLPATRLVMQADMMHDALMGVAYRAIVVAEQNNPKEQEAVRQALEECKQTFTKALSDLDRLALPASEKSATAQVRPTLNAYVASGTAVVETAFTNRSAGIAALPEFQASFEALEATMEKLGDLIETNARQAVGDGHTIAAAGNTAVAGTVIAGVALALIMGFGFSRSIFGRLSPLVEALSAGSNETAAAAGQVSRASQSLAEGASAQAASLEETSASLEELASMAVRNTENAQRAKSLGREARDTAEVGRLSAVAMGEAITGIRASGQEMVAAVDGISASSREVSKIIKTIDEIAFQTNILALNAAVEAARAGEAGLGFAVVADEVRNLAQRSASAARETATKIEESLRKSAHGVEVTQKVNQHLADVQTKVAGVESSLQAISEKVRQVDEVLSEVANASNEQTQGVKQINTAVSQLDRITQSNAAGAEESASASEQLNAQAKSLAETVGSLRELAGIALATGARTGTSTAAPASPTPGTTLRTTTPASESAAAGGGIQAAQAESAFPMPARTEAAPRSVAPSTAEFRDF